MNVNKDSRSEVFVKAIDLFIERIDGLALAYPLFEGLINSAHNSFLEELKRAAESDGSEITKIEGGVSIKHSPGYGTPSRRLGKKVKRYESLLTMSPQMIIISLVSQYDALVGDLVRAIYIANSDIVKSSEKKLTFKELSDFGTLDTARNYVIETEIENLLRKSHSDHIKDIGNMIGISTDKRSESWPDFIELTQRRHLFVHSSGKVTYSYLNNCKNGKYEFDNIPEIGQLLETDASYIERAFEVVFEIGVKLAYVIWQKILPKEINHADESLSSLVLDLIESKKYKFAIDLVDFRFELKNPLDIHTKYACLLNKAQAYKWSGQSDICSNVLNEIQWDATSPQYHLAYCVLVEDYEKAVSIMNNIGSEGDVDKSAYMSWPIFRDFRKLDAFVNAYADIFGEEPTYTTEIGQDKKAFLTLMSNDDFDHLGGKLNLEINVKTKSD